MNILIAEDEVDIRNLLKLGLEQEGYTVISSKDGLEALEIIQNVQINLAIFDVMMPRLDGFNLLRKVREFTKLPVIFLTARGDDMDKILGLGIGADDYLVKPFSMAELIARVGAQLRRNHEYSSIHQETLSVIEYGDISLDKDGCSVTKNGEPIELNAKEFGLLKFFMENPSRVFTKKQLYKAVWDDGDFYDDNTIMVHISHLRTKLEDDPRNPLYLITVRGIGYKFNKCSDGGL